MLMLFAMRRRKFLTPGSQTIVRALSVGFQYPAYDNGQSRFDVGRRRIVNIEPLAAGISTGKLLGQQFTASGISFPRDVFRRVARMEFPQSGKILFTAFVVLAMTL